MAAVSSLSVEKPGGGDDKESSKRRVVLPDLAHEKIAERVQKLIQLKEKVMSTKPTPFNRILLKFGIIRETFRRIHRAFHTYDTDRSGSIEYGELVHAMRDLGATKMSDDDIKQVFHEADVYHSEKLSFKSFLICLALGYLLGDIPIAPADGPKPDSASADESAGDLEVPGAVPVAAGSEAGGPAAVSGGSGSGADGGVHGDGDAAAEPLPPVLQGTGALQRVNTGQLRESLTAGDGRALAYAFNLVLDSYIQFDLKCTGVIRREELEEKMSQLAMLSPAAGVKRTPQKGGKAHSDAMHFLSEERFAELDFDHDGTITFIEWLFAFFNWVEVDEDEDEEDEAPAAAAGAATGAKAGGTS